ncbi:MAG: patatin-like phospholipase family protein [Deltaproteobacteria bacterium]|nr:MAG: patatin-like phospholipase family protein [Deltaproteobacteria bacterium]
MARIIQEASRKNSGMAHTSRLGVVFSSGFFGFFAHAGFLAALRDLEIAPSGYAGASSGAILAAMAAADMGDPVIKEILFNLKKSDFWDPDPVPFLLKRALNLMRGYTGYLRGDAFARLLEQIPIKRFEDCQTPVVLTATNLTHHREESFSHGDLIMAIQASGAVPMLFKPVEIDGSLYVDGGMVNKAPVKALADLIQPEKIIVHFIASVDLESPANSFLERRMTPWHIHSLAVDISRQEAYQRQCDLVKQRGIEIIEVKTDAPSLGPNTLEKGPSAYKKAREATLKTLEHSFKRAYPSVL